MGNEYTRDKVLDYIKEMRDTTPEEIKFSVAKRAKYNFNMLIDEENPLEEVYSLIKKNSQQL